MAARLLLALFAAGSSLCHSHSLADDTSALLQTSTGLATKASCKCLNWRETYASGAVQCGAGLELMDPELSQHPDGMYCVDYPNSTNTSFFKNSAHNYCINVEKAVGAFGKRTRQGSWCYVDPSCNELNGGKSVNSAVSYKMCQSGASETLSELSPKALFGPAGLSMQLLGKGILLDTRMLAVMAYEWSGPMDKADPDFLARNGTDTPVVGVGMFPMSLSVKYKEESWFLNDGPWGTCLNCDNLYGKNWAAQ